MPGAAPRPSGAVPSAARALAHALPSGGRGVTPPDLGRGRGITPDARARGVTPERGPEPDRASGRAVHRAKGSGAASVTSGGSGTSAASDPGSVPALGSLVQGLQVTAGSGSGSNGNGGNGAVSLGRGAIRGKRDRAEDAWSRTRPVDLASKVNLAFSLLCLNFFS